MRSGVPVICIAVLIGSTNSAAAQISQRNALQSNSILNVLNSLQPEPIRSILLLNSGRSLEKDQAARLESDLLSDPENIDNRIRLIGFYSCKASTPADLSRLRGHVLWMIQNHPEHPATGEPALIDLPDDPEGDALIFDIWSRNVRLHPDESAVLKNAERYYFGKDPTEADRIIHVLSVKEPDNGQWAAELALLYRMCGVPGAKDRDAASQAEEAYSRVLDLTRNAQSRRTLAGDMAEASFKVGDMAGAAALAQIYLATQDAGAVQRANTILGRIALREGDLANSKRYLIDSSKQGAARYVAQYGPKMVLARELLEAGQRDAVLEYLERCLTLWPGGENALRTWMAEVRDGKIPSFGNLGL